MTEVRTAARRYAVDTSKVHPLECAWTVWINDPAANAKLKGEPPPPVQIGGFDTIQTMLQWMMHGIPELKCIVLGADISIFRADVAPLWEHAANVGGGRWMCSVPVANMQGTADVWRNLYLSLLGGTLDGAEGVVGIVLARRKVLTRFSVWVRGALGDRENAVIKQIGLALREQIPSGTTLEFQNHGAAYGDYRFQL